MKIIATAYACLALLLMSFTGLNRAAAQKADVAGPNFTIENYYKVKWGYAEEFISLWKKNHYPLLKKAQEKGDIIRIDAVQPILHSGEDTRWDFKVTIVFKNVQLAIGEDVTVPYKAQLYPDTARLAKEEQHRFELLLSHWDVMVESIRLQE